MIKQTDVNELVSETYGGETYEYYPLGEYIVRAPGVCGGRPTFKYTRLEARVILWHLAQGRTIESVLDGYSRSNLSREAILEAIALANQAWMSESEKPLPLAV